MRHAIRELIANALDEQILSNTQDINIANDASGNWHIRDFGRGLRYEYLTQNENLEKLKNAGKVIGKFGVGLKDALATLNRRKVGVLVRSAHCDISLIEAAKHSFEDVITLQATVSQPTSPEMTGTDFELRGVSSAEVRAAEDFFLKFSGEHVLDQTPYGQILEKSKGRPARVYVTGLLVAEEERFAFSYNITSLTAAMRRALNRERTNVGRTAYTERVKAMLLASQSKQVAELLAADLSNIGAGTQHDEVVWTEVAVHACQILNVRKKVLFVTAEELEAARDAIDHARKDGYEVIAIPGNVRHALVGLKDLHGNPMAVTNLGNALHLDETRLIVRTMRKEVVAISWMLSTIFNFVDEMFKLRTDQPLFFPTERIFFGFPSNFLPLFLHLLEIDPSMAFCPRFLLWVTQRPGLPEHRLGTDTP